MQTSPTPTPTPTPTPASQAARTAEIKRCFEALCDASPDSWSEALAQLTADEGVQQSAMALLLRDKALRDKAQGSDGAATPDALRRAIAAGAQALAGTALREGERLGVWRIDDLLGTGGMGSVYRAERADGQYQQTVALKVLSGQATARSSNRMVFERQTLAQLAHPHIARLIDGGTAPNGSPYIVMELIAGQDIGKYCSRGLDLPSFVRLFAPVCDAVEHAHRRLVLHCDIKPSNIFVTNDQRAMLLDFGIAQWLGSAQSHAPWGTASAGLAFTPTYASPEQSEGKPLSTQSDVYSLGKVLQRLGRDVTLSTQERRDFEAIVRKATMHTPSERYASALHLAQDLESLLAKRPVSARAPTWPYVAQRFVQRRMPWVVAGGAAAVLVSAGFTTALVQRTQAIRAEAATAEALVHATEARKLEVAAKDRAVAAQGLADARAVQAEDARQQADEARAQSDAQRRVAQAAQAQAQRAQAAAEASAQVAKAERSKAESESRRAAAAQALAEVEAKTSGEVQRFLASVFEGMRDAQPGLRQVPAYDVLERGRKRAEEGFAQRPELRSGVMEALGRIYDNIGDLDQAAKLYEQALQAETANAALPGVPRRPMVESRLQMLSAFALLNAGRSEEAEGFARRALATRQTAPDSTPRDVAGARAALGLSLSNQRKHPAALEQFDLVVGYHRTRSDPSDEDLASALHNQAQALSQAGQLPQAVLRYEEAVALKTRHFGPKHPSTFNSMEGLGAALRRSGETDRAVALLERLVAGQREVNGPESERFASSSDALANALFDQGRYAAADARFQDALAQGLKLPEAERSFRWASYAGNRAQLLHERGDLAAAASLFTASQAVLQRRQATGSLNLARSRVHLARLFIESQQIERATAMLADAALVMERAFSSEPRELSELRLAQIELALAKKDPSTASTMLARAMAVPGLSPSRELGFRRAAAQVADARADVAAAAKDWQLALDLALKQMPNTHPRIAVMRVSLAKTLLAAGQREAALAQVRSAQPGLAELSEASEVRKWAEALPK